MNINEAQAVIHAACQSLNEAFAAKGHESTAEIWISRNGTPETSIYLNDRPSNWGHVTVRARDLESMLAEWHAKIAALPHRHAEAKAYEAELNAPLFLMSEQHAQAAE